jgi:hypothetical protein
MSGPGFQLSLLRDGRLAPLATSALPAWLWRPDGTRIVWANATGVAVFGATSAAIGSRRFAPGEPAADQIARIAASLSPGAAPRLERLRGFGAGIGRALTCACSHIVLADDTAAVLVAAIERAGPDLPLGERVARLLAGSQEAIAAFSVGGQLMAATEGAHAHLRGATSLAAIGAGALVGSALASGHTVGRDGNPISLDRIGSEAATVLIAQFAPAGESMPQRAAAAGPALASPPPATPTERRHPLRFVWQMNEGRPLYAELRRVHRADRRAHSSRDRTGLAGGRDRAWPRSRGAGRARGGHARDLERPHRSLAGRGKFGAACRRAFGTTGVRPKPGLSRLSWVWRLP